MPDENDIHSSDDSNGTTSTSSHDQSDVVEDIDEGHSLKEIVDSLLKISLDDASLDELQDTVSRSTVDNFVNLTIVANANNSSFNSGSGSAYFSSSNTEQLVSFGAVSDNEISKINAVFVKPDFYDTAFIELQTHGVIVLEGNSQSGRRAIGLSILSRCDVQAIIQINSEVSIGDWNISTYGEDMGYLVEELKSLSETNEILKIVQMLRKNKSFLVVTATQDAVSNNLNFPIYNLRSLTYSERQRVLKRHVTWYIKINTLYTANLDGLIQQPTVQEALSNLSRPFEIDQLAYLLVRAHNGEFHLEDIGSLLVDQVIQHVDMWFTEHKNLVERLFMICLGVFNESAFIKIANVFEILLLKFENPEFSIKNENPLDDILEPSDAVSKSKRFHAHVEYYEKQEVYGTNRVECITFDNPYYQRAVLVICQKYLSMMPFVYEWLKELGSAEDVEIRTKIATAVGELSKYDFDNVYKKIINFWAKSGNPLSRMSAATALSVSAWDEQNTKKVLRLLHSWCSNLGNLKLTWTAIHAYGSLVGLRFPDVALSDMSIVYKSLQLRPSLILYSTLQANIIRLFRLGRDTNQHYFKVINALHDWIVQEQKKSNKIIYSLVFLQLCKQVSSEDRNKRVPSILQIGFNSVEFRKVIAQLFSYSIRLKSVRKKFKELFRSWIDIGEANEEISNIVITFLEAVFDIALDWELALYASYLNSQSRNNSLARRVLQKLERG